MKLKLCEKELFWREQSGVWVLHILKKEINEERRGKCFWKEANKEGILKNYVIDYLLTYWTFYPPPTKKISSCHQDLNVFQKPESFNCQLFLKFSKSFYVFFLIDGSWVIFHAYLVLVKVWIIFPNSLVYYESDKKFKCKYVSPPPIPFTP